MRFKLIKRNNKKTYRNFYLTHIPQKTIILAHLLSLYISSHTHITAFHSRTGIGNLNLGGRNGHPVRSAGLSNPLPEIHERVAKRMRVLCEYKFDIYTEIIFAFVAFYRSATD